jgi:hypothetical protein
MNPECLELRGMQRTQNALNPECIPFFASMQQGLHLGKVALLL